MPAGAPRLPPTGIRALPVHPSAPRLGPDRRLRPRAPGQEAEPAETEDMGSDGYRVRGAHGAQRGQEAQGGRI